MKDKVYVIDTSGFIAQVEFRDGTTVTVPAVVDEIVDSTSRLRFDLLKDAGLRIELPDGACLKKVRYAAISTGDASVLSVTDLDILAKALELKNRFEVILVTDDYAIQNVAANLGIEYMAAATSGIRKKVVWELKCTGCGNVVKPGKAVESGKAVKSGKTVESSKAMKSGKAAESGNVVESGIECPICGSKVRRRRAPLANHGP